MEAERNHRGEYVTMGLEPPAAEDIKTKNDSIASNIEKFFESTPINNTSEHNDTRDDVIWQVKIVASIAELSKALISLKSIDDISSIVLAHARKLTGSEFGYVGYIHPDTGHLVCPTLTKDVWDKCKVQNKSIVFSEFHGLFGWVLKNKKPILTNTPQDDSRSHGIPSGHVPINKFLSVPAMLGDELLGQIALANPTEDYSEKDLVVVTRLASLYAIAIQRERAEEKISRLAKFPSENPNPVLRINRDGLIIYCNKSSKPLLEKWRCQEGQTLSAPENKTVLEAIDSGSIQQSELKCGDNVYSLSFAPVAGSDYVNVYALDITEGKKAEEALRSQRDWVVNILNTFEDGIHIVKSDYEIEYANPSLESLFGEWKGKKCYEYLHKTDKPCENCKGVDGPSDGEKRWEWSCTEKNKIFDVLETPIVNSGSSQSKLLVFRDITELRKQTLERERLLKRLERYSELLRRSRDRLEIQVRRRTADLSEAIEELEGEARERLFIEKALRQSEEQYRNLAENTNDILYLTDRNGLVTYIAPQVSLYGFKPDEIVSQSFLDFVIEEEKQKVALNFKRRISTGDEFPEEFRIKGKDGRMYWFEDHGKVQRDDEGNPLGVAGVLRDITLRKRAQNAVRKSQQKYRELVQSANSIIMRRDINGKITFFNEFAQRFFGYPEIDILGKNVVGTIVPPSDSSGRDLETMIKDISDNPESYAVNENENMLRDGKRVWIAWTNKLIRNEDANPIEILSVGNDITQRKVLEREILEVTEREQRRIGRDLHDSLGQNLTGLAFLIEGFSRKLKKEFPGDVRAANQMVALINEAVSQVRYLARGLDPIGLDKGGLMAGLREMSCNVESVFGVPCKFEYKKPVIINNELISAQMYHIAQEAINNATKHSKAKHIRIMLKERRGGITLSIADDGIGISEKKQGTRGMGLHIMRYRAENIGGKLTFSHGRGGGTVVKCTVPWTSIN